MRMTNLGGSPTIIDTYLISHRQEDVVNLPKEDSQ